MRDYLIDMFLRNYMVVGVNKSKIEDQARVRELRHKFKSFCEEWEVFETLEMYFKEGQKAEIFMDDHTKQPLKSPMDQLRFKFTKGNYTYLMMRIPSEVLNQQAQQQAQLQNLIVGGKIPQKPMSTQDFLRQYEVLRAQPRAQRGKVGGKSKYLPKTLKPPSKEEKEITLEMCREAFKDVPEEPTIKEAEE